MILFLHLITISFESSPDDVKILKKPIGSTLSATIKAVTAACRPIKRRPIKLVHEFLMLKVALIYGIRGETLLINIIFFYHLH